MKLQPFLPRLSSRIRAAAVLPHSEGASRTRQSSKAAAKPWNFSRVLVICALAATSAAQPQTAGFAPNIGNGAPSSTQGPAPRNLAGGAPGFLRGGDVSEIPEVEAAGATYAVGGKGEDPFAIMQESGWNFVRFRVWNQPRGGWCDKAHTLEMARRAKAHSLKISLDFHYSDWWADPGKQNKPAAWKNLPFDDLVKAVHDYTKDVVAALVAQDTPPIMVQIGNEILGGMLWPDGRVDSDSPEQWHRLAQLIDAGIRGVHDAQGRDRIKTMIHLDRGGDNKRAIWWFDHLNAQRVKYDLIGLSYYPFWHGHLEDMRLNVNDLATRYKKDIYIVETGYPWIIEKGNGERVYNGPKLEDGFPATPEGQAGFLRRVTAIIQEMPNGRGKGILYWAPTWISPKGKHAPYNNMASFDYDGNALPSVAAIGGK